MQHTETYNLNLIETSDTFSPDPLNQNAQLLEDAVEAEAAARTAADGALGQRVQALEAKRMKYGTYSSSVNQKLSINLGFQPDFVIVIAITGTVTSVLLPGRQTFQYCGITQNGFEVGGFIQNSTGITNINTVYFYLAVKL